MNEIWKDIEGYANYQISNYGRVKSLNYNHTNTEKLLKPSKDGGGYLFVGLCKDGKQKSYLVHRLVAQAFLENPSTYPEVNHKDENKENNCVDNLEWCDRKYNNNYGTRTEKTSKQVYQYSLQGELIKVWNSTEECGRNGFNRGHISSCCNSKLKTHKGYIWKYNI